MPFLTYNYTSRDLTRLRNQVLTTSFVPTASGEAPSAPSIVMRRPSYDGSFDIVRITNRAKNFKNIAKIDFSTKCSNCGKIKKNSEMAEFSDTKYQFLCIECVDKHYHGSYRKCFTCGLYHNVNNRCDCTLKDAMAQSGQVLRYNAKISPNYFRHSESDVALFGIELEIEFNDRSSRAMTDIKMKKWCYYKHDGSLSNGIEIVTHPLGWNWIQNNKSEFEPIFNLATNGMSSKRTRTCGMHVHLAKELFTTFHLYKFMKFFYDNVDYIVYISERSYDDLQRWSYFDDITSSSLKTLSIEKRSNERHAAINLANPETVEIRIFKGTLSRISFFKNIEFVKAVYDFTKNNNLINDTYAGYDVQFENYVNDRNKDFPNLNKFINIKKR